MKTTKNIKVNSVKCMVYGVVVAMLLLAGTVQASTPSYKNTYKPAQPSTGSYQPAGSIQATSPTVSFQSTSAYSGQWNERGTSLVNEDGSVNHEAYMSSQLPSGPRKNSSGNPGTPGDDDEEEGEQQPLGDGVWILTALACAYLLGRVILNNKRALKG